MRFIELDNKTIIYTDKIVAIHFGEDDRNKITLWLVGGFIQVLHAEGEKEAKSLYNKIKDIITET